MSVVEPAASAQAPGIGVRRMGDPALHPCAELDWQATTTNSCRQLTQAAREGEAVAAA